jgi:hypothetical protein
MLIQHSRRGVLHALAGATFAASTARFFLRSAEAQTFPRRFLFVFTNAGRDSESRSTGTGPGYTLGAGYEPMRPYQAKITILDGLKIPPHTGEEHPSGKAALLTGRAAAKGNWKATGMSFDRYLAGKLTAGVSFFTGTFNGSGSGDVGVNPVSWNGAGSGNDGFLSGSKAFVTKLFGTAPAGGTAPTPTPPTSGAPTGPSARDQNEIALYDYLMADVNRLKAVAPKAEVEKLELHVQALMQLRSGFVKPGLTPPGGSTGGTAPPPPVAMVTRQCGATVDLAAAAAETDKVSLGIANAFACDRARIGVVRIGTEDPYHNYSHWMDGASHRGNMRMIDKLWATNFANLLAYLDSFKEGTGTVLDHTLVVWGSDCCGEYGVGQDSGPKLPGEQGGSNGIHNTGYMPFVLAGGLGGKIKTGQRIVLPGRTNVELFRTIAAQLGVDASDFGDSVYFKGLLNELAA